MAVRLQVTVSVDVLVAGVSLSVVVGVCLVAVWVCGTVITRITKRVAVRVLLVFVGDQAAVVLKNREQVTWSRGHMTAGTIGPPPTSTFLMPSPSASSSHWSPMPSLSASS